MVDLGHSDFKLTDIPTDLRQSISKLVTHIKSVIEANEEHHGRKCGRFYIGKSYLHARKRGRFDPDHPKTTSKRKGITGRWNSRKKAGFHVMAIIAVITDRNLPEGSKKSKQQYALDLESSLIIHFRFTDCDPRLENETTQPGGLERSHAAVAYVLYMAIKFEDIHDVTQPATSDEVKQDDRLPASISPSPPCEDDSSVSEEDSASELPPDSSSVTNARQQSPTPPTANARQQSPTPPTAHARQQSPSRPTANARQQPPSPSTAQTATPRDVAGEKQCRCGSSSHQRTNHRQCPLNKRNQDPLQPLLTEIWPRK